VSTPTVTTGPLRRVPVQGRSVARVQRMLDACAELVDEVGYEGLTTTLLAERAEVAIGSVYQFFPDKRAIVQALATDARARAFTDGIVALAATRGLTVTAEGVEDSATWDRLADMGVEQAQGYLIARPLLAIAVPVWLRRWPRRQAAD